MGKKLLLTGAGGFIGKNIFPLLQNAGYEVHAVSTKERKSDDIEWHRLNLFDKAATGSLVQNLKPDFLLHLAWDTTPGKYIGTSENLDWVSASLNLCKAFYQDGGKRAVFAGTCFEYDLSGGVLSEDSACAPSSLYGTCKLSLCNIIKRYCGDYHLSYAWGRIFYMFGPYENENRVIPYVIRSLLSGNKALCSEGLAKRDYLYVKDVAAAFVHLLSIEQSGIFNIGSGKALPLKDILQNAADLIGRPELLILGARISSANEPPVIEANDSRFKQTGYMPKYDLNIGLKNTIEWWKKQKVVFR